MAIVNEIQIGDDIRPIQTSAGNVSYNNSNVESALNNINSRLDNFQSEGGTVVPSQQSAAISPIQGLKVAILGDSIATQSYSQWPDVLEKKFGVILVGNNQGKTYSIGGAYYSVRPSNGQNKPDEQLSNIDKGKGNTIWEQTQALINYVNANPDKKPDIVLIHGGTNDTAIESVIDAYSTKQISFGKKTHDINPISYEINDNEITATDFVYSFYGDVNEIFEPVPGSNSSYRSVEANPGLTFVKKVKNGTLSGPIKNEYTDPETNKVTKWYDYRNVSDELKTLAGGMRFTIETIWEAFPEVNIMVTTPVHTANGWYRPRMHVNRIIKEVAAHMSIPVCDLTYESRLNPWTNKTLLADGLHPTIRGSLYLGECIGRSLVNHFGWINLSKKDIKITLHITQKTTYNLSNGGSTTQAVPVKGLFIIVQSANYDVSGKIDTMTSEDGSIQGYTTVWKNDIDKQGNPTRTSMKTFITNDQGNVQFTLPRWFYVFKYVHKSGDYYIREVITYNNSNQLDCTAISGDNVTINYEIPEGRNIQNYASSPDSAGYQSSLRYYTPDLANDTDPIQPEHVVPDN